MKLIKSIVLILLLQGLIACSTLSNAPTLPDFPLFKPSSLGQNIKVTQIITSQVDEESQVLLTAWSVEKDRMDLIGLTIAGQEILRLQYDGENLIESYNPALTVPINGRTVISQIQFAYWPQDKIEEQLSNSSWQLVQDNLHRRIKYKDTTITTIKAKSGNQHPAHFGKQWPVIVIGSPALDQHLSFKTVAAASPSQEK